MKKFLLIKVSQSIVKSKEKERTWKTQEGRMNSQLRSKEKARKTREENVEITKLHVKLTFSVEFNL